MPVVLGAGAVALVFLLLTTLLVLYWMTTRAEDTVRGWAVVGNILGDAFGYISDRNAELIHDVAGFAHNLLWWADDKVREGVQLFYNLFSAAVNAAVTQLRSDVNGLQNWVISVILPELKSLRADLMGAQNWIVSVILPALKSLRADLTGAQNWIVQVILPELKSLRADLTGAQNWIVSVILPELKAIESLWQTVIIATVLPAVKGYQELQHEWDVLVANPVTGALTRIRSLESSIANILPWVTAIGLSLPIAQNLARLGRNPCWCITEGPLQQQSDLELATLMDLI